MAVSAASGAHLATDAERKALADRPDLAARAFSSATGHLKEAQMPLALALAAMSAHKGKALPPLDIGSGMEKEVSGALTRALVVTAGFHRSEGAALVSKA